MMQNANKKRLFVALLVLLVVYIISVLFYRYQEGWNYLDCAYFVTMTITTIGYGDLVPRTDISKIYTIVLAFSGISIAFYIISILSRIREKTLDERLHKRLKIMKDVISIKSSKNNKIKNKE